MSKDIKDYLHLYLGCECQADENVFKLAGVELTDTGTLAYDGTMINGIHQCWWVENCDFKLMLRPLLNMSDEERREFIMCSNDWNKYYKELGFISKSPEGLAHTCKYKRGVHDITRIQSLENFDSNQFLYLLSKHFDLFGLIEAGLAIDKTKLNQPA